MQSRQAQAEIWPGDWSLYYDMGLLRENGKQESESRFQIKLGSPCFLLCENQGGRSSCQWSLEGAAGRTAGRRYSPQASISDKPELGPSRVVYALLASASSYG